MQSPKASVDADTKLYKVLMNYNDNKERANLLEYIKDGEQFEYEGQIYQRIMRKKKKIECVQVKTGKKYIFSPIAEVFIVE